MQINENLSYTCMSKQKRIVIDLDHTLCTAKSEGQSYSEAPHNLDVVNTLRKYHTEGFYIIIFTSRNMNSFEDNLGKINANTAPIVFEWLKKHDIPYDEIYFGKPWCGFEGFYVDDRAIRPSEFVNLSYDEIRHLIKC